MEVCVTISGITILELKQLFAPNEESKVQQEISKILSPPSPETVEEKTLIEVKSEYHQIIINIFVVVEYYFQLLQETIIRSNFSKYNKNSFSSEFYHN